MKTTNELFLNSRVLPEAGEQIVILRIYAGQLERTGPFTVGKRGDYLLTDEEYVMDDGCRHHVKGLYPNDPTGGPDHAPWGLASKAACSIQARLGDETDATRILLAAYRAQCLKVAAEMRETADALTDWAESD